MFFGAVLRVFFFLFFALTGAAVGFPLQLFFSEWSFPGRGSLLKCLRVPVLGDLFNLYSDVHRLFVGMQPENETRKVLKRKVRENKTKKDSWKETCWKEINHPPRPSPPKKDGIFQKSKMCYVSYHNSYASVVLDVRLADSHLSDNHELVKPTQHVTTTATTITHNCKLPS